MEKDKIIKLIKDAIKKLVENDDDIFKQKIPKLGKSTEKERKLNRELHETALNHRLAFYIEQGLLELKISNYNVDIEYNRNFSDQKRVKINGVRIPVRPDILVHKRMRITEETPHLLIVEAKKHKTIGHDINKVQGFMEDREFKYKFGLTISYAYDSTKVKAVLYYRDDQNKIKKENIEVDRI